MTDLPCPPPLDPGPFALCPPDERAPGPRHLESPHGLGDRLRTAAFAEWQAITAFAWAADRVTDAPDALREDWRRQVDDEVRHYDLIIGRMTALAIDPAARPVSDRLWRSLSRCTSGRDFCLRIAAAEERGRQAALKLIDYLGDRDPETSEVFRRIAADEVEHVALAVTYYDVTPEAPEA
jgi:uncharacterized ferritin-like protein (DUF455 family)